MSEGLPIRDVAERSGLSAATIRMWEQRYGFPVPQRLPNGYRCYAPRDVDVLRRAVALRDQGMSVTAALEQAQHGERCAARPSLYGATLATERAEPGRRLRKRTLLAISRAIEDEALARAAAPFVVGAFQSEGNFRAVEHRYRRLARTSDAVVVFADFPRLRAEPGAPIEVPIQSSAALTSEWAVVVDAPGYGACLLAWEHEDRHPVPDDERRFEAVWTVDPRTVRSATTVAARLAGEADPEVGSRLDAILATRPLPSEEPAPALTALTNRMLAYLEP